MKKFLIAILSLAFSMRCEARVIPVIHKLYVSLSGNDHNAGTKYEPLASVEKAKDAARSIRGPVIVYLRKGIYYFKSKVVFDNHDSRRNGETLTFRAFPREKVIISSAIPLHLQWKRYKGGIMEADIPSILFDQLFVNGKRQLMARYPNYNPKIKPFGGYAADALSPERMAGWRNPSGAYIHSLHNYEWGGLSYEITGRDKQGQLIAVGGYQNNRPSAIHPQIRYVENVFEELDTAGEYYVDQVKHILYYYPPQGTRLANARIETPQLETLFAFNNCKNIKLSGLELTQTLRTFMKTREPLLRSDWKIYRGATVLLDHATGCSLNDCYFNTVGGNAIFFSNYNRDDTVSGCHIERAGASGIAFAGDPNSVRSPLFSYEEANKPDAIDLTAGPKTNNYPADCLVYNNLIEGIGQVEKQSAGVEISMSQHIIVRHNTIDDVPRAGINIGDGTWGGHVIEGNDVFNTVLETGDHGSFNSWGRDRYWNPDRRLMDSIVGVRPELILLDAVQATIIRNNRFRCDHGWDIDLDDGSSNYEIYNNLCLHGGLKLREGFYRKVYNNIIVGSSFHPHVWFKKSGDVFTRNIVSAGYFPIGIDYWGEKVDDNLFPDSVAIKNGPDQHSIFGDPMYIDAASGNYQVKPGSPAFRIGFVNFPMDDFGVVSARLKAVANKVQLPLVATPATIADVGVQFIGATVKNLNTLGERSATGMDAERGIFVVAVSKKSLLYGKIMANDVILELNKKPVNTLKDLQDTKTIESLGIFRDQKIIRVTFKNGIVK